MWGMRGGGGLKNISEMLCVWGGGVLKDSLFFEGGGWNVFLR